MKKQKEVVVVGVGRYGKTIIEKLNEIGGYSIVAIDNDPEKLEKLEGVKNIILGDASNEEFLKGIGIENADFYVISLGSSFKESLIIASFLNDNYKGTVIAKSINDQHSKILKKLGIKNVIDPEIVAAKRTFNKIINPLVLNQDDDSIMNEIAEGISIVKIPPMRKWIGMSLKKLTLPRGISILLIFRKGDKVEVVSGETIIHQRDIIAIIGHNKQITKLTEELKKEEIE